MLTLGDKVKPYGTLVMIGMITGERYYWFIDEHKSISMIPSKIIEDMEILSYD